MRTASILASVTLLIAGVAALEKPLDIEVTHPVECSRKTKNGDKVEMHYRGTLEADGSASTILSNSNVPTANLIRKEFDASYNRNQPLSFHVGKGQVIQGWDQGLLDMCVGEKRRLTIQPELGYGKRGMGPIPANSVLIFETELVSINGDKGDHDKDDL